MIFHIRDIVVNKKDWKLYKVDFIFEDGVKNYIQILSLDSPHWAELVNHEDIELIKKVGTGVEFNSKMANIFDMDDSAFRESLPKKPTKNIITLFKVWLARRRFNAMSNL